MSLVYDPTGKNPDNKFVDEYHNLTTTSNVMVTPLQGNYNEPSPFFEEGMILKGSLTTNAGSSYTVLKYGEDYLYSPLFLAESMKVGQSLFSYVILLKPFNHLRWTYQSLGSAPDYGLLNEITAKGVFDTSSPEEWLTLKGGSTPPNMNLLKIDQNNNSIVGQLNAKLSQLLRLSKPKFTTSPVLTNLFNKEVAIINSLLAKVEAATTTLNTATTDPNTIPLIGQSGYPVTTRDIGTGFTVADNNSTVKDAIKSFDDVASNLAVASRVINSGVGTLGGGNLTADRTLSLDFATAAHTSNTTSNVDKVMSPVLTKNMVLSLTAGLGTVSGHYVGSSDDDVPTNEILAQLTTVTSELRLVPGIPAGAGKWFSGVLYGNQYIYGIPYNSAQVLKIDCDTSSEQYGTAIVFGTLPGNRAWQGGLAGTDEMIYGIPGNSDKVLLIDPVTDTTSLFGEDIEDDPLLPVPLKWFGGTLVNTGHIYGIPYNATQVLKIDTVLKEVTKFGIGISPDTEKYRGGSFASNKMIYCAPYNATQVLKIDPELEEVELIGSTYVGAGKYSGNVLAFNGAIYCIPYNATQVLKIDPLTDTTSLIGALIPAASRFSGGITVVSGRIYCMAENSATMLVIDPSNDTVSTTTTVPTVDINGDPVVGGWAGATMVGFGSVVGVPHDSNTVLMLDLGETVPDVSLLSPYYNKF